MYGAAPPALSFSGYGSQATMLLGFGDQGRISGLPTGVAGTTVPYYYG